MSNIWLTRPLQQADALRAELSQRGMKVLHIPMLEIEALELSQEIKTKILNFDQYDLAFFISTNAARLGMEGINNYWPQYPPHIKNVALGPSTAAVLQSYDLNVLFPAQAMSSEAVLEMSELSESALKGRKIVIFRGVGGRELLAEGLRARGASVDYIALYRRNLPHYSVSYLQQCLTESAPDGIVISSAEALENFIKLFKAQLSNTASRRGLLAVTLFVSSQRIRDLADGLGFEKIIAMPGANDGAIIESLDQYCIK